MEIMFNVSINLQNENKNKGEKRAYLNSVEEGIRLHILLLFLEYTVNIFFFLLYFLL